VPKCGSFNPYGNEQMSKKKKTKTNDNQPKDATMEVENKSQNTGLIQYNTIQYNTIQYNTIQYNTIQQ